MHCSATGTMDDGMAQRLLRIDDTDASSQARAYVQANEDAMFSRENAPVGNFRQHSTARHDFRNGPSRQI